MKLTRYKGNPILAKNPNNPWEAGSVLNPNVLFDNGIYRMVYRATNDIKVKEAGGYMSSIGYAESVDGIHFKRFDKPLIIPDQEYEMGKGCEDPRVTKINDTYFLYYTAVSERVDGHHQVRIALATSKDFKNWTKCGIVGPPTRSKAAILFPEKINGQYVMFYTWMPDRPLSSIVECRFDSIDDVIKPTNQIEESIYNFDQNVVFAPPFNTYRGAEVGAPPIKTQYGWLFIYCMANTTDHPEWSIGAALLDLKNPKIILYQTKSPILTPEKSSEKIGITNNVVFPGGATVVGKELYVYYGSGDQGCCLANCNLQKLFDELVSLRGVKDDAAIH